MHIQKYIKADESDYIRIGNKMIPKDTRKFDYDDSYDDISNQAKRDYQAELDAKAAEEKRKADIARGKVNYSKAFANFDESASVDDQLSSIFDAVVPSSGKCDNLGSEFVRAMMRVMYRDWNDGDVFYEGYGLETCCPDVAFLMDFTEDDDNIIWQIFNDIVEGGIEGDAYTEELNKAAKRLIEYLKENPQLFGTDTKDSRSYYSRTVDEIKDSAPKFEFEADVSGDLERYIDNGCLSWDDVAYELENWADNGLGGRVNQWALDAFTIEDLDREQLAEWENEFDRYMSGWLDDLENEFPNYGESEEEEDDYEEYDEDEDEE